MYTLGVYGYLRVVRGTLLVEHLHLGENVLQFLHKRPLLLTKHTLQPMPIRLQFPFARREEGSDSLRLGYLEVFRGV